MTLAYPGLRLRPDVYATHGHYLDLHLTVPRLESIAASAMGRLTKLGRTVESAADYETILGPMYAFYAGLAQGASARALARGSSFSRTVWKRASDGRAPDMPPGIRPRPPPAGPARAGPARTRPRAARCHARPRDRRRDALPARAGDHPGRGRRAQRARPRPLPRHAHRRGAAPLGPRGHGPGGGRAGARRGARRLRPHPPAGAAAADDLAEWTTPSGTRLWNSGSWLHEGAFLRTGREAPTGPARCSRSRTTGRRALRTCCRDSAAGGVRRSQRRVRASPPLPVRASRACTPRRRTRAAGGGTAR